MKNIRIIAVLALLAAAAIGQNEYVSGERIEAGNYREIDVLRLSGSATVQLRPGQEYRFRVLSTVFGRHGMFREVVAPTAWKVSDAVGVTIDETGNLKISPNVQHGTKFLVIASVTAQDPWEKEAYPRAVEQEVIVFDAKQNPLVGDWTQKWMTTCAGKKIEVDGRNGLRMLEFRADGTYAAAVAPFEAYRDYWGRYVFDPKKGTLNMTVDGGNSDLIHLKTQGSYEINNGTLTITGMQLHPNQQFLKPCKAHFTK